MVKKYPTVNYFVSIIIALGIVVAVVMTIYVLQKRQSASLARQSAASSQSFTEDFSSDLLKDGANTTALWETAYQRLKLSSGVGGWYKMDSINTGFDNVSNNAGSGDSPSLALDSQDSPAVAWSDTTSGNNEIFYAKYSGAGWSSPVNVSNNAGWSITPSLALDSQGYPAIAWSDPTPGNSEILYAKYNGSSWSSPANISNNAGLSDNPSLVLDSADNPVIAWRDTSPGSSEILYASHNGTSWNAPVNISSTSTWNNNPSLVLDSAGNPAVAWQGGSFTNTSIFYSGNNGTSWSTPFVVTSAPGWNISPNLAFDSLDNPAVVWSNGLSIFYSGYSGTSWSTPFTITTSGYDPSFTIDFLDRPSLAWHGGSAGSFEIFHSSYYGTSWSTPANVSNIAGNSYLASLALNSLGNPAIAWIDTSPGNQDIAFSQYLETCASAAQAQSLAVDLLSSEITQATLNADETLLGGTVDYSLSNDGGTSWESVSKGVQHSFASTGSDLRWRAQLTPGAGPVIGACPIVNSLSIDYTDYAAPTPQPDPTVEFIRITGDDQVEKSINVSLERFAAAAGANAGLITRSDIAIDSFTSGPLVNLVGATMLLNDPDTLEPRVLDEFNRALGANSGKTVYIAGGPEAISSAIEKDLQAAGFKTVRLGDQNRRGTAIKIAQEIVRLNPGSTTKVFLAEDQKLADALGANAIAGDLVRNDGNVMPIILNERGSDQVDPFTASFLAAQTEIVELQLIGGPEALAASLPSTLQSKYPNLTRITRIDGLNRFDTNIKLVMLSFTDPTSVVIAAGEQDTIPGARSVGQGVNYSDILFSALLSGPYAADTSALLMIIRTNSLPPESLAYLVNNTSSIKKVVIIGSLGEVSQVVEDELRALF